MKKLFTTIAVLTACVLCVSSAKAALLLDWQNGTLSGTPPAGVSGSPSGFTYQFSQGQTGTITVTLNVAAGYTATGVSLSYTLANANGSSSITINSTTYSGTGINGTRTATTFANIANGGSDTFTFNITAVGGARTIEFSDIQFNGTVSSVVPEPISYALAGFGLLFVGGTAGRFYLGRKNAAQVV